MKALYPIREVERQRDEALFASATAASRAKPVLEAARGWKRELETLAAWTLGANKPMDLPPAAQKLLEAVTAWEEAERQEAQFRSVQRTLAEADEWREAQRKKEKANGGGATVQSENPAPAGGG